AGSPPAPASGRVRGAGRARGRRCRAIPALRPNPPIGSWHSWRRGSALGWAAASGRRSGFGCQNHGCPCMICRHASARAVRACPAALNNRFGRKRMKRRSFLKTAGVGLAGSAIAAPAIAQSMPEIKWRLAASWPKSLDTLYGGAELLTKLVAELTDNKFQIRAFAAGEIVPALQVLDAVQNNTVEMGHTGSYYYIGKDPTFALDCTIPFGMNYRQMNAWMTHGGGLELLRRFFTDYNIHNIPAGNTGAQMGGWFRKEIKTVSDLNGLEF